MIDPQPIRQLATLETRRWCPMRRKDSVNGTSPVDEGTPVPRSGKTDISLAPPREAQLERPHDADTASYDAERHGPMLLVPLR